MPDLQSLMNRLTCGDDEIADAAAERIAAMGAAALPSLSALWDSANPEKRWWALRTLAGITHPEVLPRLLAGLRDPDPTLRQCAALGLRRQPTEDALPPLITALDDPDRLLARLAADALIALGSPALPNLIATLKEGSPPAQIEAARALAHIADPAAIPALFEAWQSGSTLVQHWAEQAFERMGIGMQFFLP